MRLVIKVAGALLDDEAAVRSLARQIAELAKAGHELLVVHGGGKIFTATLERMGIDEPVCGRTARDGSRNARCGRDGFCGAAQQATGGSDFADGTDSRRDLRVRCGVLLGRADVSRRRFRRAGLRRLLDRSESGIFEFLWRAGIVPVACCLGLGADGELYNINADHMAAAARNIARPSG